MVGQLAGRVKMSAIIVDKKEKKRHIIQSALRIFSRKGFNLTTISDIAEEAGIGKGTVYEYFDSKEAVISFSFDYFMQELVPDFEAIIRESIPASEKLERMISGFGHILSSKENQDLLSIMFDVWAAGIRSRDSRSSLESKMKRFYQDYRSTVSTVLRHGVRAGEFRKDIKPHVQASLLIGLLDGLLVQWILDKREFPLQTALEAVGKTFLYGLYRRNGNTEPEKF